jgi:predicted metal-dependent hydrolase
MLEQALERARRELAQGKFFEAHETLEDAWHELPEGPLRLAVQGLVQLCAGLHKGKGPGARYLFERGLAKVEKHGAALPAGAALPFLAAARKAMLGA